ncbi:MAG: hypothetical protein ABIB71_08295 [Candidatus Woesearchaeota archaeon]
MKISQLELRRQAFHLGLGAAVIAMLYYNILNATELFIVLALGFIASMLCRKRKLPVISWLLKMFDRKDAKFPGEGAFFMVAGMFLVYGVFPRDIAFAAIAILALGDSVSHILGKTLGKRKLHKKTSKTWLGTIAGLAAGFVGAAIFVPLQLAFIGAAVAMLLEAIELKYMDYTIDDNIFIPVVAAIAMHLWVTL